MTKQIPTFKPQYDNFIGGKFIAPVSGVYFDNISPIVENSIRNSQNSIFFTQALLGGILTIKQRTKKLVFRLAYETVIPKNNCIFLSFFKKNC